MLYYDQFLTRESIDQKQKKTLQLIAINRKAGLNSEVSFSA